MDSIGADLTSCTGARSVIPVPPAAPTRRVFIKTFGCQMNVYDSERMSEALAGEGYVEAARVEDADLIILNTCHIREKAAEKVYSELGKLRLLKEARLSAGAETIVVVAGCVAQAEGHEIVARAPVVDLVIGPQSYHRLPELLAEARSGTVGIVETAFPEEDKFSHLPKREQPRSAAAFLTVQEGCDKFCTFCVVPYTRGMEYSRSVAELVAEARSLVERGVREISLLGQNVNGYHGADDKGGTATLAGLIRRLAAIDGLERIRYTTSHPRDMAADLIEAHASEAKLMPYLHLPVQSGSDRILAAMNRKHTARDYLRLIERIRAARPDMMMSGDFIVGFPGETEADFAATMDLIRAVGYGMAYSFKYSARPGTPAAERKPVDGAVADARLQELQALITAQQHAAQAAMIGREVQVLFEKPGRLPGQMGGKSDYLHAVHAHAPEAKAGDIARVRITASAPNSLAGERVA